VAEKGEWYMEGTGKFGRQCVNKGGKRFKRPFRNATFAPWRLDGADLDSIVNESFRPFPEYRSPATGVGETEKPKACCLGSRKKGDPPGGISNHIACYSKL
jgi:hypothetical protein